MNDLNLRNAVLEELEFQPDIDAAEIGVAVHNGVVTLSGHAGSYGQKIRAEQAVKAVKGVRAVVEDIEIRLADGADTSDETIAARALNIISWNAGVPAQNVRIVVHNGWITLEGDVEWQYQKEILERSVRKLTGVVGVYNRLAIRPKLNVADIQHRIEQALKRNAELDAKRIHVKVDGNVVKLEGQVHLWREREVAERAAWSVPGVAKVDDHLKIA